MFSFGALILTIVLVLISKVAILTHFPFQGQKKIPNKLFFYIVIVSAFELGISEI